MTPFKAINTGSDFWRVLKNPRLAPCGSQERTALISAAVTGKIDVREFVLEEAGV